MLRRANVLTTRQSFDKSKYLTKKDLIFHPWGVKVVIRWTKTIQFKERTLVIPLARIPNSTLCPVQAIFNAFSKTFPWMAQPLYCLIKLDSDLYHRQNLLLEFIIFLSALGWMLQIMPDTVFVGVAPPGHTKMESQWIRSV